MSFPYSHPFLGLSNGLNTIHAADGAVGGWVELGRTTLGSASSSITVSSLADKRYYMVLVNTLGKSASANNHSRLNSDTGSNYSRRLSEDGGADGTGTSINHQLHSLASPSTPTLDVCYLSNLSSKEKLMIGHSVYQNTAGAGNAPRRSEYVNKHAQTSNPINEFQYTTLSGTTFNSGSEVVVLGWDPADTHTNNFWEELASVDLSGGAASSLSSGSFTSKKYLWIQYYVDTQTSAANIQMQVGNGTVDSSSNYARRANENGGSDGTATNSTFLNQIVAGGSTPIFANMFIINNASNEKLSICHSIDQNTTGASTAPNREEDVGKWANTSNQINIVEIASSAGNMGTNTTMKIWGAD